MTLWDRTGGHLPVAAAVGTAALAPALGAGTRLALAVALAVGLAAREVARGPADDSAAPAVDATPPGQAEPAVPVAVAPRRDARPRGRRGTEEAVRDVAELAAASLQVAERSRSAVAALTALQDAAGEVADGARVVTTGTSTARRSADAAAERVEDLLQAGSRIGDVTGLISSITDQTRTLALNATIEAARAGVAGRGFGVVAAEVKELALATARAARAIDEQVLAVQDGTRAAADAIRDVAGQLGSVAAAQEVVGRAVARQGEAGTAIGADVEAASRGSAQMADLVARRVEAEQRSFVTSALDVARDLLDDLGGVRLGEGFVDWVVTGADGSRRTVTLPPLLLGKRAVAREDDPAAASPLVDEVRRQVGGTATLFQRLDASGTMLRVATNVVGPDGRRAVGTVLAPVAPDGAVSPVLRAVLAGETYVGEALVLGRPFYAAYAPLTGEGGEVVGVLYVGLPKQG